MVGVGSAIVDTLGKDPVCPTCQVYKEWLDEERSKREYYEQLYLARIGAIKASEEIESVTSFPSVHRVVTLSSLRQQAVANSRNRNTQPSAELAKDSDKTEAELLFESALNGKETS